MECELRELYELIFKLLCDLEYYFSDRSHVISETCKDLACKLDKLIIEGILK